MTKQLNRLQWRQVPLNDVCLKIQDGAHNSPKEQFSVGGPRRYMYVTSKNIRNNFIDLSNVSYVSQDFHDQIYPRCTPEVGDVLLTKDGANTGNVTLNTIAEPFSLLSSVALIKTDPTVLMPEFLSYYSNRENPRLCRGGSRSLTYSGVAPETPRREPPSKRQGATGWMNSRA